MTPKEREIENLTANDLLTIEEQELKQLIADYRKEVSEGWR